MRNSALEKGIGDILSFFDVVLSALWYSSITSGLYILICYIVWLVLRPRGVGAIIDTANLLSLIKLKRQLFAGGRKGNGKTLFCAYLLLRLYAEGFIDRITANVTGIGGNFAEVPLFRSGLWLDEGQRFANSYEVAAEISAFSRKLQNVVIISGVLAPHPTLTKLTCHRLINAYVFGFPLWVIKVQQQVDGLSKADRPGWYVLANPDKLYDSIDTLGIPQDDGGILEALKVTAQIWEDATEGELRKERLKKEGVAKEGEATKNKPSSNNGGADIASLRRSLDRRLRAIERKTQLIENDLHGVMGRRNLK